ncbi:glutamate 5-kinase [Alicyclobacillus fastidiosus]|uniref:Glutamate 5-kinase n=1 Tax=Alicyclobacillus fastidiosus TaxID=392011 RepID=A0ABY6ZJU8_9BACL|nr:glutamate 5-kinase [Alicyclobacillus fastidiosus]WAH43187.1 glutamate 5-kinase [Alicyclobacillus fastidiosus]
MEHGVKHRWRMVVKVGSSSITDHRGRLSLEKMRRVVAQLAALQKSGRCQVILVSSGAIAAGLGKLGWNRASITLPEKQAAAAVGQTLLMETYERLFGQEDIVVGQLLLTRLDIEDRKRFVHIRNTILTLLHNGIVPIVNENDTVAVDEIRFGDNDSLASLTALVSEAERLVLLTDIDGLYTGDPKADASATRLSEIWEITREIESIAGGAGSSVGTGGMRTKISAAKAAVQSGIDVVIASSEESRVLLRIADGEAVGTLFHARPEPLAHRKSWLIHGPQPGGVLVIDEGAVQALVAQAGSLLLPGVMQVQGDFQEGTTVALANTTGHVVGKGITNFSARDLDTLVHRRQSGERLYNVTEVVHRNNMVVLEGGVLG